VSQVCKHSGCPKPPVARVSGGVESRHVSLSAFGGVFRTGWSGEYCQKHVLSCVSTQMFQVGQDLPIVIEGLK
jgi:hypothetical protein